MAVPKKRTGASAQGHRRSNWKATLPETTTCKNCGALALTHTVCTECGTYKGKVVSRKAEGFVESTLEAKKPVKKAKAAPKKPAAAKKEETVEETKVEEKAEVVKTESKKTKEVKETKAEAPLEEEAGLTEEKAE